MAALLNIESTTCTFDNMGRYLCDSLQEALDSTGSSVAGPRQDVVIIGAGSFGQVVPDGLNMRDPTRIRLILVFEQGSFALSEFMQNVQLVGGDPDLNRALSAVGADA